MATSWRSDGVRERSEVGVGNAEYKLAVEVLVTALVVVVVERGEEGLVTTATSKPPATSKRVNRNKHSVHTTNTCIHHNVITVVVCWNF